LGHAHRPAIRNWNERMPFLLHRPGTESPSTLTESDVRRILSRDLPDAEIRESAWRRLNQGERIFVKGGFLTWEHKPV
jgi:hypothetical protein